MKLLITLLLLLASNAGAFDVVGSLPQGLGDGRYVQKAGDTMTGQLTLSGSSLTVTGSAFSVGGSTLVVANGKVGVGTTSPATPLEVSGDIVSSKTVVGGEVDVMSYNGDTTNSASGARLVARVQGASSYDPRVVISISGLQEWNIGADNSDSDKFKIGEGSTVGSDTKLTILPTSGNVGIGNTTPGAKLDVVGDANISTSLTASSITAGGGGGIGVTYGINAATGVFTNTGAASLDIGGGLNAGTGNVAIIDATGKITALSSTYLADLSGANLTSLTAANISAGSLGASVIASSITLAAMYGAPTLTGANITAIPSVNISAGALDSVTSLTASTVTITGSAFSVGGSTLVVSAGNVGIGTTAPGSTLDVNSGNIFLKATLPSASHASASHFRIGSFGAVIAENNAGLGVPGTVVTDNAYVKNAIGDWAFIGTDEASQLLQTAGNLRFKNTVSGTADTAITWVEKFTVLANGNVGIANASPSEALEVIGGIASYSQTMAQLLVITPSQVGVQYFCNNCTPAKMVVSTGTSAGNFADIMGGTFQ